MKLKYVYNVERNSRYFTRFKNLRSIVEASALMLNGQLSAKMLT